MSMDITTFDELEPAIFLLESLAYGHDRYIFRGHNNKDFRLQTTLARNRKVSSEMLSPELDLLLNEFRVGLAKIGIVPFAGDGGRQDWLEYARHYGVPTPCIDFTHSPYVALFFAFTGMARPSGTVDENPYVAVYGLNVDQCAYAWLRWSSKYFPSQDFRGFCEQDDTFFQNGYPKNRLKVLPEPSKHNVRMQRQFGAMLYDSLDYPMREFNDLEDFIQKTKEHPVQLPDGTLEEPGPTLTKVLINTKCARQVFERLELMRITGASLFDDEAGVAIDIMNSYYYNPKTSNLRGINFPEVDY